MYQRHSRFSSSAVGGRIDSRAAMTAAAHRAQDAIRELHAIDASERTIDLVNSVKNDLEVMLDDIEQGPGDHADSR